jgi:citrate synthase
MNDVAKSSRYLNARDAASLLGVTPASLYAYVSRGRIHAETDPRNPRKSRYLAADVERLRDHKQARLHPDIAARKSLSWGIPILESGLTLIDEGRFYYRGRDMLQLASNSHFEEVVRLLWNQDAARAIPKTPSPAACRRAVAHVRPLPVMERLQAILPFAAVDDPAAFDLRLETVGTTGWRILHLLTAAVTLKSDDVSSSTAARLARGWNLRQRRECGLLEMALILCADHELNVSAFAARVAASTGSSPYDVFGSGAASVPAMVATRRASKHSSMKRGRPPACVARWPTAFAGANRSPDSGTRSTPMATLVHSCCSTNSRRGGQMHRRLRTCARAGTQDVCCLESFRRWISAWSCCDER